MTFNIIKHRGELNEVTLQNGDTVRRVKEMYIPEWDRFVPCAPYEEHFIYTHNIVQMPSMLCTCGSPGVITNPYEPERNLIVCLVHATDGAHAPVTLEV